MERREDRKIGRKRENETSSVGGGIRKEKEGKREREVQRRKKGKGGKGGKRRKGRRKYREAKYWLVVFLISANHQLDNSDLAAPENIASFLAFI